MREWLKKLRLDRGYTQKEMGDKLCVSESYYSMIESGERQKRLDLTVAASLSTIFGIPIAAIIANEQTTTLPEQPQNSTGSVP